MAYHEESLGTVLPIYCVVDHSWSMSKVIGDLNDGLSRLLSTLQSESFAASRIRFSLIGFSDTAQTYVDMSDIRHLQHFPEITTSTGTSYKKVFRHLLQEIPRNITELKSSGYTINRPAVFFLTDGCPSEFLKKSWQQPYEQLLSTPTHPNILAFGIGKAEPKIISYIATKPEYAFMAQAGEDISIAISNFITALTQSVISSGQALGHGTGSLLIEKPHGFLTIAEEKY